MHLSQDASLSFLPTIRDRKRRGQGEYFSLDKSGEKVELKLFPHHLMSESSDAAIDSLNQSRNEERNHNSNLHFKQEI